VTERLALLLGLFVVPLLLLILGHRLRDRGRRQRAIFWGGVLGHTAAMLASTAALHYPPVLWSSQTRVVIAFWMMLLGGVAGAAVGALLRGRREQ
jgi:hypothetical protein